MLHDILVPDPGTYLIIKISVLILALLVLMIVSAAPVL
ncbi:hypothetical protein NIES2107_44790 [Nostoc carneum NIES-2107]|nr:hypothetical protein NIES2107_44790 [Nostoc carneum NIES-2107]BAY94672.1 hypothetical protein NIES3275_67240 [Microchaete diplosiphon NIES-3275]